MTSLCRFAGVGLVLALFAIGLGGKTAEASLPIQTNLRMLDRVTRMAAEDAVDSLGLAAGTPITVLCTTANEGNDFVKRVLADVLADRGHDVIVVLTEAETDSVGTGAAGGRRGARWGGAGNQQGANAGGNGDDNDGSNSAVSTDGSNGANAFSPGKISAGVVLPRGVYPDGTVLDVEVLGFGVSYSEVGRKLLLGSLHFTRVVGAFFRVSQLEGPSGELRKMVTAEQHYWDRLGGRQRVLAEGESYPFRAPELTPPSLTRIMEPAVVVGIVGSLIYLFYANQN